MYLFGKNLNSWVCVQQPNPFKEKLHLVHISVGHKKYNTILFYQLFRRHPLKTSMSDGNLAFFVQNLVGHHSSSGEGIYLTFLKVLYRVFLCHIPLN